jgi:hypothetical protein
MREDVLTSLLDDTGQAGDLALVSMAKRADVLFKVMYDDQLLRTQFLTNPFGTLASYCLDDHPDDQSVQYINRLVYLLVTNEHLASAVASRQDMKSLPMRQFLIVSLELIVLSQDVNLIYALINAPEVARGQAVLAFIRLLSIRPDVFSTKACLREPSDETGDSRIATSGQGPEPITDPVTIDPIPPFPDPVPNPITDPFTNPVTDPVTDPITDPFTDPVSTEAQSARLGIYGSKEARHCLKELAQYGASLRRGGFLSL